MIIRRLHLHPFAGLADRKVEFEPGLNVVFGPNEAGKSTLVSALWCALFLPTKSGKKQEAAISQFVPVGGGDTICVDLTFRRDGAEHTLAKSWGARVASSLTLPGGELVADAAAVQERLTECLTWGEGTYRSVLFTFQSGLGATLEDVGAAGDAEQDLGELLRAAVFETEGVSVERLGALIEAQHDDCFSRWDADLGRPAKGRGIDNPWQKEVGRILEAWYEQERARRAVAEAEDFERRLGELNTAIREAEGELAETSAFVEEHAPVVADARQRVVLTAQVQGLRGEEKRLRDLSQAWPAAVQQLKTAEETVSRLSAKVTALDEESRKAQAHETARSRLALYERARPIHDGLAKARAALARMRKIAADDFRALKAAHDTVTRLRTSLSAGRLALEFTAEEGTGLTARTDLDEATERRVEAGETLDLTAGGQIELAHPSRRLRVRSGDTDFEHVSAEHDRARKEHDRLIEQLSVRDLDEATGIVEAYDQQSRDVASLQQQLDAVLGRESYDELKALAESMSGASAPQRSAAVIAREQGAAEEEHDQAKGKVKETQDKIDAWSAEFGSAEALLDQVLDVRGRLNEAEAKLGALKPLPDGVTDPEAFIDEFDTRERKRDALADRQSDLRIERAELGAEAPPETAEEAGARLAEAERAFAQVEREAAAIDAVRKAFDETREAMDSRTLTPWLDELARVVAPLTANRYTAVDVTDAEAVRADGAELPFDVLSVGTRVGLGLAVRLSMARYFLADTDGFLVLDDPLVDLDPDRQRQAAEVIRAFAEDKQVILITCHPAHADLLGGNRVELRPPA